MPARFRIDPRYRAQPENPRSWQGLGQHDRAILARHLARQTFTIEEMFCHVPCGSIPEGILEGIPEIYTAGQADLYYKRIDMVIVDPENTWLIEIKPSASYLALGQILCYLDCVRREALVSDGLFPGIMTDTPDPDLVAVAAAHGVSLFTMGDSPYIPMGRQT